MTKLFNTLQTIPDLKLSLGKSFEGMLFKIKIKDFLKRSKHWMHVVTADVMSSHHYND